MILKRSKEQSTESSKKEVEVYKPEPININKEIVKIGVGFVGQTELPGNSGWKDPDFQNMMVGMGWQMGEAWCAYFTELVWKKAYRKHPDIVRELDRLFSASTVMTYWNFYKDAGWVVNDDPEEGAVVIWHRYKNGKPTNQGHAGIVTYENNDLFKTVEGNTNSKGGREGIEVAENNNRKYNFHTENGLRLKGFIHPIRI